MTTTELAHGRLRRLSAAAGGGSELPTIAINGLGRIGRASLKVLLGCNDIQVVAANDLASVENLAYLMRYDTVYGRYPGEVHSQPGTLVIDGHRIPVSAEPDPANLPWHALGVDLVLECTGAFTDEEDLNKHLTAGASYVLLSAPTASDAVPTVVHGVNTATGNPQVISCASCTTNCITPIVEIAHRRLGAERAVMTTVHAYTASQHLVDGPDSSYRRGRGGAANMVPASTGAARATVRALPGLTGRFDGIAIRAPIPVGSIADIVFVTGRPTTLDEVNDVFVQEAASSRYRGVVGVSGDPLVSSDVIADSHAAVVDLDLTRVVDSTLVKVMAWYDNEWGFTHQMIREARSILGLRPDVANSDAEASQP